MSPIPGDDFYKDLPSFSKLSAIGELDGYEPVPDDWVVLAADIVRSGAAVAEGRYKQVNLIGAAVISAVLNRLGRDRIPFIFGGDGAMLLVPGGDARIGAEALAGVARLAADQVALELRHAAIPVAHLRAQGADIRLRKYALSPDNYLAMAVGGGIDLADRILKDPVLRAPFDFTGAIEREPALDGLSCRWEPVPSRKGRMVSLILKPAGNATLREILAGMEAAIGFDPLSEAPEDRLVQRSNLRFRFPPTELGLEIRLSGAVKGRLKAAAHAIFESVAFLFGTATGLRLGPFQPERYLDELTRNTDHRKLDDSLRLVLDLTAEQLDRLRARLDEAFDAGRLVFGLHVADAALMTCFVTDMAHGGHIHFIDGADGGLSMAGADFKARLAERDETRDLAG